MDFGGYKLKTWLRFKQADTRCQVKSMSREMSETLLFSPPLGSGVPWGAAPLTRLLLMTPLFLCVYEWQPLLPPTPKWQNEHYSIRYHHCLYAAVRVRLFLQYQLSSGKNHPHSWLPGWEKMALSWDGVPPNPP